MTHTSINRLIRNVSLRQLQIFEAVVRFGGYTRAAEALHLSQPTISSQIKKLSDTLGHTLLEQAGGETRTTAVGQNVYMASIEVLEKLVELGDSVSEKSKELKGDLRISVVTTAKYFVPRLLASFTQQNPGVTPHLTVANRATVLERLKSNEDDLFIMGQVPSKVDVGVYPFIDNKLVVAASPNHPMAKARGISLETLSRERIIMREKGSGTRQLLENLFTGRGIQINPYMELGSSEAIKQCVMAGLGVALLSQHNLQMELASNYVTILPVNGFPLVRSWYAVHQKNKKMSVIPKAFLDVIRKEGENILMSGLPPEKQMKVLSIKAPVK